MPITESAVKELKLELTIIRQFEDEDRKVINDSFIDLVPRVDFAKQAILSQLPSGKEAKVIRVNGEVKQTFAVIFAVDENGCGILLFSPNTPALRAAQRACGSNGTIIGFGEFAGDLP